MLAQQMEKFEGLEQRFDKLLRTLTTPDSADTSTTPLPPRKRKPDKHLYKTNGGRRVQPTNAGTTTPLPKPPDPNATAPAESNPSATHNEQTQSDNNSTDTASQDSNTIDMEEPVLNGGIQDDDLSEGMMHEWEESQTLPDNDSHINNETYHTVSESTTPVVRSKDNKAKQC